MTQGALSGIQVLDFTRVLAGPLCTMLLGDLGAEIIKIENPSRGDDTREWGPPWLGDDNDRQSAYFLSVNRNKRSITINLKSPAGLQIIRELIQQSHILIENFKVGQMAQFGLDYQNVRQINPQLVYCSITGFGQTGNYQNRPGYDYVIQAMSGLMSITGEGNHEPQKVGVAISDVIAGLFAYSSIQSALRYAEQTGIGQYLDVSLLDTQIAALVNIASNALISGQNPPRLGNQHPNIVPYQTFQASDGNFVVAVGNDRQFQALCKLINRLDLAQDERFSTNPQRVKHREILIPILQETFQQKPKAKWVEDLLNVGVPSGEINTVAEILHDPHIQARGLVQETTLANGEVASLVGSPVRFSETPANINYPPPKLGEHTDEILQKVLGYDMSRIHQLRQQGVI